MKKTHVVLVDDIDNSIEAVKTVNFALNGTSYEIDLSQDHVDEFEADFAKWVAAARKISGRGVRSARTSTGPKTADVRAWAKGQGIEISDRGRIPAPVLEAYLAAKA